MRLKIAFMHNHRLEPLIDGGVRAEDLAFDWDIGHPATQFKQHLTENAHDVFEFSIADYLISREKPECADLRWKALPIFLQKAFLFIGLHVNERSGIRSFADLAGKRVGVPDFQMTAALWMRIVLKHLYGIRPQDINWINGRPRSTSHGSVMGLDERPPGVQLRKLEEGESLNEMLQRGEVDAAFGDSKIVPITTGANVRVLLTPETALQLIADFYAKTGTTPINHTVMVQERLLAEHPELAMQLYELFERSKQEAYARAKRGAQAYLLFADEAFERQARIIGEDPYPSGMSANRRMLGMIAEQLLEEGLLQRRPDIDLLFAEPTRST